MRNANRGWLRPSTFALAALNLLVLAVLARSWWWGLLAGVGMGVVIFAWTAQFAQECESASLGSCGHKLQDLVSGVLPLWERNVELADSQMRESVDALVRHFSSLAERLHKQAEEGNASPQEQAQIAAAINELLVHLQFQDRVNQILGHVRSDMLKLGGQLAEPESVSELPSREVWLAELQGTYTTLEQQALHPDVPAPAANSSQVTFF